MIAKTATAAARHRSRRIRTRRHMRHDVRKHEKKEQGIHADADHQRKDLPPQHMQIAQQQSLERPQVTRCVAGHRSARGL